MPGRLNSFICALDYICRLAQGCSFGIRWKALKPPVIPTLVWVPKCIEICQGQRFAILPSKLHLCIEELCFETKPATNLGYVGSRGSAIRRTFCRPAVQLSHQETKDDGYGAKATCLFQAQAFFKRFVDHHLRQIIWNQGSKKSFAVLDSHQFSISIIYLLSFVMAKDIKPVHSINPVTTRRTLWTPDSSRQWCW